LEGNNKMKTYRMYVRVYFSDKFEYFCTHESLQTLKSIADEMRKYCCFHVVDEENNLVWKQ